MTLQLISKIQKCKYDKELYNYKIANYHVTIITKTSFKMFFIIKVNNQLQNNKINIKFDCSEFIMHLLKFLKDFNKNNIIKAQKMLVFEENYTYWLIALTIIIFLIYLYSYIHGYYYRGQKKNLKDKYAIITGGNAGIGKQTLRELAYCECKIIIGARDRNKSLQVIKQIVSETKNKDIEYFQLNLASRSSIESFVKNVYFDRVDYLINNAGVFGIPKLTITEMGFEMHQGINHQGHFYLTYLLWEKLQKSKYFRIINVSSRVQKYYAMYFWETSLDLNNINFEKGGYSPHLAYARSKIYNVMFTKSLSERIDPEKGIVVSLHPGSVRTQIIRQFPAIIHILIKIAYPFYCFILKSEKQGVQTTLHCIFQQSLKPGAHYQDCQEASINKSITKQNYDQLWKKSEETWGITFWK